MDEQIRVLRIRVSKLFDAISYDIRLKDRQDIGIITAPNGKGKTTVLNLLAFLLSPSYLRFRAIRGIPFSRFDCTLSNGKCVSLRRIPAEASRARGAGPGTEDAADCDFELSVTPSDEKPVLFSGLLLEMEKRQRSQELEELMLLAEGGRSLQGEGRPVPADDAFGGALRQYLKRRGCAVPVVQIGADRLRPAAPDRGDAPGGRGAQAADPMEEACRQIGLALRKARAEYNEEVAKAKDTLPRKFLENDGSLPPVDELRRRWKEYSEALDRYRAMGLVDAAPDFIREEDIPAWYESKGDFLRTYMDVFSNTTRALEDDYAKLNLFKQIFDERNAVTGKTVRYTRDGIRIYSGDRPLNPSALSSGEKHDFIMFYHLIFSTGPNSLILIDEPEISLHIEWQESYIGHLARICGINRLQALIATHSPHIISNHFDCLLDKGESHED